jgi:translation initiation factor IF-3
VAGEAIEVRTVVQWSCLLGRFTITKRRYAIEATHRINDQIRISPVRLVSAAGEILGVVPTADALQMAREAGLDLVLVASNVRPPVCRVMDYKRFQAAQKKRQSENAKRYDQEPRGNGFSGLN